MSNNNKKINLKSCFSRQESLISTHSKSRLNPIEGKASNARENIVERRGISHKSTPLDFKPNQRKSEGKDPVLPWSDVSWECSLYFGMKEVLSRNSWHAVATWYVVVQYPLMTITTSATTPLVRGAAEYPQGKPNVPGLCNSFLLCLHSAGITTCVPECQLTLQQSEKNRTKGEPHIPATDSSQGLQESLILEDYQLRLWIAQLMFSSTTDYIKRSTCLYIYLFFFCKCVSSDELQSLRNNSIHVTPCNHK